MFRLSLARRLTPIRYHGQHSLRATELGTRPAVSGSFAADLHFAAAARPIVVPKLSSQVRDQPRLLVKSRVETYSDGLLHAPDISNPATVDLGTVAVFSRLAIFLPHFGVYGRNYAEVQGEGARRGPPTAEKTAGRPSVRPTAPPGTSINKWDALWPLLQPPLNFAFPETLDLPSDLRMYQIDGVRFLADHEAALLGDDMGTGKTVQAAVALRILAQKGKVRKALIVCPLAVLSSWERHILEWGRVLNSVSVRGNRNERKVQWKTPAHVYIATYDTVREDAASLMNDGEAPEFDLIIADEVQRIKNSATATSQAVRSIKAARRWGMSATPFENRPEELVSVFGFIQPGILIRDRENAASIQRKIAPYFLRRTKEVLKGELPEKTHDVLWLELGSNQRRAYDLAEQQGIVELQERGETVTVTHVLALLQKLKQLCNFDPRTGDSIKLDALREQLQEVYDQGSKALVFTQFKEAGVAKIKGGLRLGGVVEYTGDLTYAERERTLLQFAEDPACKLMICTQAAAGLGLNLTAANYVFHFDHWWNPARTAQAEDRVHRIGQKKAVFVYHLWVKKTVEQRIYSILQRKRAQFEEVLGPMSNTEGTGLSEDELFEVFGLKRGPRKPPAARVSEVPQRPAAPEPVPSLEVPDIDVWPLIRQTELALRKCVREVLARQYGVRARDRVLKHLGDVEAQRISEAISHFKRRFPTPSAEFSASEDPLDYTYLAQMMAIISREWQYFQPIFQDRAYVDGKVRDITPVRNDEAHFRSIPPVEKMRAYVACSDLLARLQHRPAAL